jgi:hypothetical protein
MRCRLDFFKQDLIVLTVVGIPNLSSVGVVPKSEEEGFFLNLGQEIVEFDEERESVVGSRSNTVLVGGRYLRCRLPPIKREPDCDPFLERNVLDLNNTSE